MFKDEEILKSFSYIEYFPFWVKTIADNPEMLSRIISNLIIKNGNNLELVDYISVAITAELSDAFQTKREGILTIIKALKQVFDEKKIFFINNENSFTDYKSAIANYLKIMAANLVSTSLFLGRFISTCVLIDAGSTTIDVIPILNSIPVAKGNDDVTRMVNHELLYRSEWGEGGAKLRGKLYQGCDLEKFWVVTKVSDDV